MGLFDFLKAKKENKWAKEKEKTVSETPKKKYLGVCVPNHAKSPEERKKMPKEINPFDKLRSQHDKEIGREVKEILEQEPEEPYDFAPELGVESVASGKEENAKEKDEIDNAIEKLDQGYVPRFSSTARQKLGYETAQAPRQAISASLEVKGVYVGAETMISGRVLSGRIRKSMSSSLGKGTIRVSDLKKGSMTVPELNSGEEGTIFVRGNASMVKYGDVLDFS